MTDEQINDLRRRIDAGEQVSTEEITAGLAAIRQARVNAPTTKKSKVDISIAPIKIDLASVLSKIRKNPPA